MKLLAPLYYKEFKCIADKCLHSCCIGWEIDVDAETIEKYSSLSGEYSDKIRASIDVNDTPHFKLQNNERCPHLDDGGLCRIISEYGEECLCEICREHPRFYNDTLYGKEVGIGMSCEEAARIILSSDSYREFFVSEIIDGEPIEAQFDAVAYRKVVYDILSNRELPYFKRLIEISRIFDVSLSIKTDEDWRKLISSLEYLDESRREEFLGFRSDQKANINNENKLERALAYFIFRHCTGAYDMEEFRVALGLSLFCERLLSSLAESTNYGIDRLARIISEEIEYSEENTEYIKSVFY